MLKIVNTRAWALCNFEMVSGQWSAESRYAIFVRILFFKKKWANPGLFFVYFRSFQTNNTIFTTIICEKCPSNIWCWDSNPRPLERESLPTTTRPGLPAFVRILVSSETLYWQKLPNGTFPYLFLFIFVFSNKQFNYHSRPLFHLFSSFHANNIIASTITMWNLSIQYAVLGFEPTTSMSPPTTTRPGLPCLCLKITWLGTTRYREKCETFVYIFKFTILMSDLNWVHEYP